MEIISLPLDHFYPREKPQYIKTLKYYGNMKTRTKYQCTQQKTLYSLHEDTFVCTAYRHIAVNERKYSYEDMEHELALLSLKYFMRLRPWSLQKCFPLRPHLETLYALLNEQRRECVVILSCTFQTILQ